MNMNKNIQKARISPEEAKNKHEPKRANEGKHEQKNEPKRAKKSETQQKKTEKIRKGQTNEPRIANK